MQGHIYLDESGDLGWKFDFPYRYGGSSRYLTIGYLIHPLLEYSIPKRIVRDFYKEFDFDPGREIKAFMLKPYHKEYICYLTNRMLEKHPNFILGAITANKAGMDDAHRIDGNVLYNFMIGEALISKITQYATCKLTRDKRIVKTNSVSSCIDYLQTLVFHHHRQMTVLIDNPVDSHANAGIIFIDWITNIVWSKYEDGYPDWCDLLKNHLHETLLYF